MVVLFLVVLAALSIWMTGLPGAKNLLIGWSGLALVGAMAPNWVGALVRPGLLRADSHGVGILVRRYA